MVVKPVNQGNAGRVVFNSNLNQLMRNSIVCGFIVVLLNGCGVPTDEGVPADSPTYINAFSIEQPVDLPVQFNNETASTLFKINWNVESSDPFSVLMFISSNASVTFGADDAIFFSRYCGSDPTEYACRAVWQQECAVSYEPDYSYLRDSSGNIILVDGHAVRLTNPDGSYIAVDHYVIRCSNDTDPQVVSEVDITQRLNLVGFPATALNNYIVFGVCNELGDKCSSTLAAFQIYDADPTD